MTASARDWMRVLIRVQRKDQRVLGNYQLGVTRTMTASCLARFEIALPQKTDSSNHDADIS